MGTWEARLGYSGRELDGGGEGTSPPLVGRIIRRGIC